MRECGKCRANRRRGVEGCSNCEAASWWRAKRRAIRAEDDYVIGVDFANGMETAVAMVRTRDGGWYVVSEARRSV